MTPSSVSRLLVGMLAFSNVGVAQAPNKLTVDAIVKAWQARQARVKSGRFVWTERQTYTKGSQTALFLRPGQGQSGEIPPKDTTVDVPHSMSFDGESLRYVYDGPDWSEAKNDYVAGRSISTFNGKVCKTLLPLGTPSTHYPTGSVKAEAKHIDAQIATLQPILMTYRGLVPAMRSYPITEMQLGHQAIIDGRPCLELFLGRAGGKSAQRLWVDPSRGYVIVRYAYTQMDRLLHKIDVRFQQHSEADWVPTEWDMIYLHQDGSVKYTFRAKITEFEINSSVDPEDFDIQFPSGAVVTDEQEKVDFIVRPDGSKRIITKEEMIGSYEHLLENLSGGETLGESSRAWQQVSIVAGVIAAISLGLLIWRRRRAKLQG